MLMTDLFTAAAERAAIVSGRPVSQERLRVRGTDAAPAGPLLIVHGFARDKTFCGLDGGTATTDVRRVTCEACRKALGR
jgi:hypothetical protein